MKKIFSFVVVLAAVAMVGCAGNSNKKAAEVEAEATEAAVECTAVECTEECDSTKVCAEACDSTKAAAAEEVAPVEETK